MPSIQERRHRDVLAQLAKASEQRDEAITRLVKLEGKLKALRRQARRYEKLAAEPRFKPKQAKPDFEIPAAPISETVVANVRAGLAVDDDIPEFLRRKKEGERKDAEAKAAIEAEQAERKKIKAQARIGKRKADRKAMPLSGKAALKAIYGQNG